MLVEVRIQSLGVDPKHKSPVVILRESDGERLLPIFIGGTEAQAIAIQLADVEIGRPLTHDLLVSVLKTLGCTLERVEIPKVEQNTYYAELVVSRAGETLRIDARPSDSIALALRTGSPIFAHESLLELIELEITEAEEAPPGGSAPSGSAPRPETSSEGMTSAELEAYLRSLNPEDFGRFKP